MNDYHIFVLEEIRLVTYKTSLPDARVRAKSPIEAIRKYWRGLQVERRQCKLEITSYSKGVSRKHTYFVDSARLSESVVGQIGWWVLRNKKEYKRLRDNQGNALFELPEYRFLVLE